MTKLNRLSNFPVLTFNRINPLCYDSGLYISLKFKSYSYSLTLTLIEVINAFNCVLSAA